MGQRLKFPDRTRSEIPASDTSLNLASRVLLCHLTIVEEKGLFDNAPKTFYQRQGWRQEFSDGGLTLPTRRLKHG